MTPSGVACQAPLSMDFSRQEYWSGLPCPPPGGLPNPGIKPRSSALQSDSLPSEPPVHICICIFNVCTIYIHVCTIIYYNEILLSHKKEWSFAFFQKCGWISQIKNDK